MRDKYKDKIQDGDLVLINTRKYNNDDQELYEYSEYSETFIPCRKSVQVGNYKIILNELDADELDEGSIRRLYD